MKTSIGEQAVQILLIEKVLAENFEVTDKEVTAEYDSNKEELGESFDQFLTQNNQTEESYKKVIRLNLLQEKALTEGIEVTDKEIQTQYDRQGTELNARHILVADEETANSLKKQLDEGADFAKLAKENSTDTGSAENGGNVDWFVQGQWFLSSKKSLTSLKLTKLVNLSHLNSASISFKFLKHVK
ncbi:peptidylprolyl isomerase [Planococcus faecalis]|uniref:peptidylprolyl isomerase n=1 Tax=Planococcus faecalis TaxID=1598147 RepID=UPI000A4549B2